MLPHTACHRGAMCSRSVAAPPRWIAGERQQESKMHRERLTRWSQLTEAHGLQGLLARRLVPVTGLASQLIRDRRSESFE